MQKYGLDHSYREHVADGIVHGLGVLGALIGAVVLVIWATMAVPLERVPPLIAYAIGLIATFSFSAAYNMTLNEVTRALLRKFDHAAIYVMIAGTYTPMALIGIGGTRGLVLAVTAWLIAVLGVYLKLFHFHRYYRLTFALYLVQGWLALLAIGPMVTAFDPIVLSLILAGGLTYTAGTLFHHRDNWPFNRAIWHGCVLAAAATHYAAVVQIAALA